MTYGGDGVPLIWTRATQAVQHSVGPGSRPMAPSSWRIRLIAHRRPVLISAAQLATVVCPGTSVAIFHATTVLACLQTTRAGRAVQTDASPPLASGRWCLRARTTSVAPPPPAPTPAARSTVWPQRLADSEGEERASGSPIPLAPSQCTVPATPLWLRWRLCATAHSYPTRRDLRRFAWCAGHPRAGARLGRR